MISLLGSGHHSNVYSLAKDYYVKVAFADDANLKMEVGVLKALEKTKCPYLPRILFDNSPEFFIGSPCGTPLYLRLIDSDPVFWANAVNHDVNLALDAAHSVGLAHLNIKPDNIIIFNEKAVLVDWEQGAQLYSVQNKLCQNGWRSEITEQPGDTWKVLPEYDRESLKYVCIAIHCKTVTRSNLIPPWYGIEFIEPTLCPVARGRDLWINCFYEPLVAKVKQDPVHAVEVIA